jgi:SAM-dependent methyltransferase
MIDLLRHLIPFTRYPFAGGVVSCPVCACDESMLVTSLDRRLKRLPTHACQNCGLFFTNPMPTEADLKDYYSRLYRLDYQGAASSPKERHLRKRVTEANHRVEHLLDLLPRNSRTLDFGCGSGEFVARMLSVGHDAYGFEPGQTYGNYAHASLGDRIQVAGWEDATHDRSFDLVTCFHVLEHLRDPIRALRQMADWTSPAGLVYVEVPDMVATASVKGFGGFHFAHLIGFNHHNLMLAGAMAGLRPKVVVSPTSIIFEHGQDVDRDLAAANGRQLTINAWPEKNAISNYIRYQLSKCLPQNFMKRV